MDILFILASILVKEYIIRRRSKYLSYFFAITLCLHDDMSVVKS